MVTSFPMGLSKMSVTEEAKWPQFGLERHIKYGTSFIHLNINLGSADACTQYFSTWIGRYRKLICGWDQHETTAWSVRLRQSLKSAFVSTHFALAAEEASKAGSRVTFYYLSYYAVLHAVWGVLYLHPDEKTSAIAKPTHSKLPNVFHSAFCGPKGIIRYQIKDTMEDLRLRREYYSYRMPLNSPFDDDRDAKGYTSSVGGIVKQCIQLSNLHSHLIVEAADREGVGPLEIQSEGRQAFTDVFRAINSQRHPTRDGWFLEPADERALSEFLTQGVDLQGHSVMLDHMFDEYMTYMRGAEAEAKADVAKTEQVRSLIFHAMY
ncbi:hypothetical protein V474_11855 [Novosphingobium barchaimii LL02]|uniref:Uncharacterized protein n=1 Tax=Novosphingobium barchaimii LL02 TaxID=1114963 RepID=A0A0J7Y8A6_9SPHN|nr:hypothetical protein [Novosphingobium barchaimii]KMS60051.1 hypothetical protein V474_11855 [Novosphingobium barchaimii LL02]